MMISSQLHVKGSRRPTGALSAEHRLSYPLLPALVKLVIEEPESATLERHLAEGPILRAASLSSKCRALSA